MKKVLVGFLTIPLLIIAIVAWPFIYNYHLFSLARLKNSIEIGDEYALVSVKFEQYKKNHENGSDLQVSIEVDQLFIYHVNSFDDCQLTVKFDASGKVVSIAYVGD